jgi:hypothetical protein
MLTSHASDQADFLDLSVPPSAWLAIVRRRRADIHDGREHNTLQSQAGYIDARSHIRQIDETLFHAGPDHTFASKPVKSRSEQMFFGQRGERRATI